MLYNQQPFNVGLWGIDGTDAAVYSADLLAFDNFSLADGTTYTITELLDSGPERDVIGGDIPRDHGRYITGDFFREKVLEVRGYIRAASNTALETAKDNLRKALRKREKSLDVTRNGVARRYVATVTNFPDLFSEQRGYHVTFCPFVIRFSCRTPFATDRGYTSTSLTLATSPTNQAVYQSGTAVAYPIVTLIFDSASSVTAVNLKRIEADSGETVEEIEYAGSIAAGSVLAFDSERKAVEKDGSEVAYTGSFPTLEPGGNLLQFTVTGSSFSIPTTIRHKNAYL